MTDQISEGPQPIILNRLILTPSQDAIELSWPLLWRVRRHVFVLCMGWILCAAATWIISGQGQVLWVIGTGLVMPMIFAAATIPSIVAQFKKKVAIIRRSANGIELPEALYYDFDTIMRFRLHERRHGPLTSASPEDQKTAWQAIALPGHLVVFFHKRSGERVPIVFERGSSEAIQLAAATLNELFTVV